MPVKLPRTRIPGQPIVFPAPSQSPCQLTDEAYTATVARGRAIIAQANADMAETEALLARIRARNAS